MVPQFRVLAARVPFPVKMSGSSQPSIAPTPEYLTPSLLSVHVHIHHTNTPAQRHTHKHTHAQTHTPHI